MERIHVKGNTFCLVGKQYFPYYKVDDTRCILLDTGRSNDREAIELALAEVGLTPCGIVLTHMHYDHSENTRYFKEKYGIPVAMPRGEAEICRSAASLKNHLFCFSYGLILNSKRLQNLICAVDRPIEAEETEIRFQGVDFGIVHSPGHSPDHICIVTPDGVCYLGDAVMAGDDLARSQIPFAFEMSLDLASKERLKSLPYDCYIVAHKGIVEDIRQLAQDNIDAIHRQSAMMCRLIDRPMNFCTCYETINGALDQADNPPVWNLHLERYLRPYIEYMVDTEQLQLVSGKGAPTVAPASWRP